MKVHVVSETEFIMKATGVHTAFLDHVGLLKEINDVEVVVNNEGYGDVFHGHTYGLYYIWKGRKYKGRRVFTAHVIPDSIKGSLPLWQLFMPFIRFGLKIVYSYADVCIAISPMVEKAIKDTGAKTKIIRVFNPVHIENWKRTKEKRIKGREMLGVGKDEFVILGVGQLIGRKGVEDFISIAERIPEARFIWVGGRPFGRLTEGIKRIDDRFSKASSNVVKAGSFDVSEMPNIYAAGDLMIFPSYQENCPLAPVEAAACGMPVVYRDIEEYRSLYENPYLKAHDLNEFISVTKRLISDRDFYNEGLVISERLLRQFNKYEIRRKLISVYTDLQDNPELSLTFPHSWRKISVNLH